MAQAPRKRRQAPRGALRHNSLDEYLDAWIAAAGIGDDKKGPLFRSFKKGDKLTGNPITRSDVLYMINFRATGITAYLQNGGTLEHAQQIAAHQSPRTTKLYDRTKDEISLDEVERIKF
jgi:integrase/recombinase XerD